jgi:hypothetical protein
MCNPDDQELQEPCPPEPDPGGHVPFKCKPQEDGKPAHYDSGRYCQFCDSGLMYCTVCGGAEGSLPDQCPGVKITEGDQQLIYKGVLDYQKGTWCLREYADHETPDLHKENEARAAADRLNAAAESKTKVKTKAE